MGSHCRGQQFDGLKPKALSLLKVLYFFSAAVSGFSLKEIPPTYSHRASYMFLSKILFFVSTRKIYSDDKSSYKTGKYILYWVIFTLMQTYLKTLYSDAAHGWAEF